MAKMTMVFGSLLVAISLGFWLTMGTSQIPALHPAGIGVLLILAGALANTENPRRRMLWMHIAVTLGLIGFLVTGIRAAIELAHGFANVTNVAGFYERVTISLVCLIFVALCVRSFIAARRARLV
jgi:uncharacterized membrane protein YjfL (UPF0719 family)